VASGALPERIRPALLGFGTLADGFLPFQLGGVQQLQLSMCSVVMKAVQGRAARMGEPHQACAGGAPQLPAAAGRGWHCCCSACNRPFSCLYPPRSGRPSHAPDCQHWLSSCSPTHPPHPCLAVKLGDDPALSKVQLDPRLPRGVQQQVEQRAAGMAAASASAQLDSDALSALLEEAYCAVARQGLLM
jgi:hypothetical protein